MDVRDAAVASQKIQLKERRKSQKHMGRKWGDVRETQPDGVGCNRGKDSANANEVEDHVEDGEDDCPP